MNLEKPEVKKTINWKKIEDWTKITAFVLLSSIPAFAQSAEGDDKIQKQNIEKLKNDAMKSEKNISLYVGKNGQEGTINTMKVKRWISSNGEELIVGYDYDKKEICLIKQNADHSEFMVDQNFDGLIDKIVLNKEKYSGNEEFKKIKENAKGTENLLTGLSSMEDLAFEADVGSRLSPKKVLVYELSLGKDGKTLIKSVNFSDGESSELIGEEAEKYAKTMQFIFAAQLDELSRKITK